MVYARINDFNNIIVFPIPDPSVSSVSTAVKCFMKIDLVIPVYNEADKLPQCVAALTQFLTHHAPFDYQLLIADNGSTDRTLSIARDMRQHYSMVEVIHLDRKGRGGALKSVWLASKADILSYMDVDLSTNLTAFPIICKTLIDKEWDVGTGSRLLANSITTRSFRREWISRSYNWMLQALFHIHFSDAQCGFKAITRSAAQHLLPLVEDTQWFFDTELLVLAEKFGYRICDIPVRWVENTDSRVKIIRTMLQDLQGMIRLKRKLCRGEYEGNRLRRYPSLQLDLRENGTPRPIQPGI
jgi:glycosyltransferase involved in cell wall biosynthesis